MYIFGYTHFRVIVACLALVLLITTLSTTVPQFPQLMLVLASASLLVLMGAAAILPKKFIVFATYCIAVSLSFSHFLLNFASLNILVAGVYTASFLTLFTLLVTNFQEKTLIQA